MYYHGHHLVACVGLFKDVKDKLSNVQKKPSNLVRSCEFCTVHVLASLYQYRSIPKSACKLFLLFLVTL